MPSQRDQLQAPSEMGRQRGCRGGRRTATSRGKTAASAKSSATAGAPARAAPRSPAAKLLKRTKDKLEKHFGESFPTALLRIAGDMRPTSEWTSEMMQTVRDFKNQYEELGKHGFGPITVESCVTASGNTMTDIQGTPRVIGAEVPDEVVVSRLLELQAVRSAVTSDLLRVLSHLDNGGVVDVQESLAYLRKLDEDDVESQAAYGGDSDDEDVGEVTLAEQASSSGASASTSNSMN